MLPRTRPHRRHVPKLVSPATFASLHPKRCFSGLPQQTDLLEQYRGLVAAGRLTYDEEQVRVVMEVCNVVLGLPTIRRAPSANAQPATEAASTTGGLHPCVSRPGVFAFYPCTLLRAGYDARVVGAFRARRGGSRRPAQGARAREEPCRRARTTRHAEGRSRPYARIYLHALTNA
jgi:hypothetical protein